MRWVAGVGRAAAAASELAALDGREALALGSLDEVRRIERASSLMVVCEPSALDVAALAALVGWAHAAQIPLGVVPWVEGARPAKSSPGPHDLLYFADSARSTAELGHLPGGFASPDEERFLAALAEGSDGLILQGHSNGADYKLGRSVVCVQADELRPRASLLGRHLPCQAGGRCLRERNAPRAIVGAGTLRARLLVFLTCWGWMPSDGLVAPELTLARALLDGPHVQAIVTAFSITRASPGLGTVLARALRAGHSAGELAWLANEATGDLTHVCLGDPELRLAPAPVTRAAGEARAPRVGELTSPASLVEHVRACALRDRVVGPDELGAPGGEDLARFLGLHTARRGAMASHYYAGSLLPYAAERLPATRHVCGASVEGWPTVGRAGLEGRTIWICLRCGIVADTPGRTPPPRLCRDGDELVLDGLGQAWVAGAPEPIGHVVGPTSPVWQADGTARFRLPERGIGPGLQYYGVAVVRGDTFSLVRLPFAEPAASRR